MKVGSNDWTKTDESVILAAVGLTFQQFGRMAMLAQGQFAAFLTGDKKEREAILEQLTNTEHFTAYGKAIESLFKKAKADKEIDEQLLLHSNAAGTAEKNIADALDKLSLKEEKDAPQKQILLDTKEALQKENDAVVGQQTEIKSQLDENAKNAQRLADIEKELEKAKARFTKWDILNSHFGGTRFRTLVQTYILRPLLNNANIYLEKITDRYSLTCSEDNEQLSILVLDRYNKGQIRSATVLSGGERFMISLALSLALSSLNRPDMNVNILFIDEGFGTLDEKSLDSVMETLEKLQDIVGQSECRVGIISHREELDERIPVQIQVKKKGEGRSTVEVKNGI